MGSNPVKGVLWALGGFGRPHSDVYQLSTAVSSPGNSREKKTGRSSTPLENKTRTIIMTYRSSKLDSEVKSWTVSSIVEAK